MTMLIIDIMNTNIEHNMRLFSTCINQEVRKFTDEKNSNNSLVFNAAIQLEKWKIQKYVLYLYGLDKLKYHEHQISRSYK